MPWLSCRIMPAPPEVLGNQCCCWLGEGAFSCLPSVVVVGAQKAGTTALFSMLAQHPWVGITRFKEMHFFNKARPHAVTGQLEVSFGSCVGQAWCAYIVALQIERGLWTRYLQSMPAVEPWSRGYVAGLPCCHHMLHGTHVVMLTAPWQAGNSCSMSQLKPHQHICSACKHHK